jgi:hypothetical protein
LGKKACTRKATTGRKSSTRAHMEELIKLGLGFLQYIVMAGNLEMYKYKYPGLIAREERETIASKKIESRGGVLF